MNPRIHPDTVLITGASSGIGAMYARRLAAQGHDLILVARQQNKLDALATDLQQHHAVRVEVMPADLTLPDDRSRIEQRLRGDDAINMLINNAGMSVSGGNAQADPDTVEAMIALNVTAPTRLVRAMLPRLLSQARGTIVNVSSVLALAPERFGGSYAATKSYLLSFSQALQREVAGHGVRIQVVLPGVVRTDIWERAGSSLDRFPADMVMEVDELVDAALAGLNQGELVTIPSLPDLGEWDAINEARRALLPKLSLRHAAERYRSDISEDA
ncbi:MULTISPECIES: SDR family NAD(P)-dependent oxidoreductase [Dyella]|uniref:SDR family oxidoreductase n=2 Tax=Dyella TaxID=231454 RepID=A0A4R0Z3H6_9GAMM|nr:MULTISPECIES: SDR family oxidoreductase [Dyella]TBR39504.1 SDR family oxidoreductase [Dyella terrae]TCI12910.1 SDR family oxidoreductase [Dyella soli]